MQVRPENLNEILIESDYYHRMKLLAQQKRAEYCVDSKKMGLRLIRDIYKKEGITIDYHNVNSSRIRASYFCEDGDCSVLVKKSLPAVQRLFALTHELKHHFVDRESIAKGKFECGDYNKNKMVEIGAECFAAEFIFPESQMQESLASFGLAKNNCSPERAVEYKHYCNAPISYKFLIKRLEYFHIIEKGEYDKIKFKRLDEELYPPIYKQKSFVDSRKRK